MQEVKIDRNIYLSGMIEEESALAVVQAIRQINEFDDAVEDELMASVQALVGEGVINAEGFKGLPKREPITIEINSTGGITSSGFSIVTAIENSVTPIIGYVTGDCMSMAVNVLASCHYRISSEYASFMMHDVASGNQGKYNDIHSQFRYLEKTRELVIKQLSDYIDLTEDKVKEIFDMSADHYFDAPTAKEFGLVDSISGEEVDYKYVEEALYGQEEEVEEVEELHIENEKLKESIEQAIPELDKNGEEFLDA